MCFYEYSVLPKFIHAFQIQKKILNDDWKSSQRIVISNGKKRQFELRQFELRPFLMVKSQEHVSLSYDQ